ncbi:hypothetical protein BO94DRAFT_268794 [Aspergillus sclerotioniger CBS 115572]|uniref:Uncharacterized protein n=1 Tax=Aspergillus sclerotioniger CBS 115572 TaxID=1450535 RepID=A0A317VBB5_9EURO|nr:hypothetical protein BO94DRAFT_268794 [Aspergillus sclerotioniger CBS 115572]PWY70288.1 hypothetical protein BO94DRAFT_268794 [Aspergillus sclerotioniger CBS 115572]
MATLALAIRPPPLDSPTDIALIWQEAIHRYEQITDQKIGALEPVTSVDGLLRQTRKTASRFRLHRHDNGKLDKLRTLIGKSLGMVEAVGNIVGSAASLAFAPSTVILSAVNYLLKTAKSVSSDYDTLNDFFKDLDQYLSQLKILEGSIPPMPELHAALARVLTSVLVLCGVSVKYTRQNRFLKGFKNLVKGEDSELRAAYAEFHRSVENENIAVRNATLVELQRSLVISTRTEQKTETIVTHTERINQYVEDREDKEAHDAIASEREDILRSLSSVKFHDKHHDVLAKHHPNTGQWLLDSDEFQQWFHGDKCTTLWCTGTAGTGKTVLTSVAVDYVQQKAFSGNIAVAYVYCDYKDPMTKSGGELIASLSQQLAEQIDTVPTELKRFHEKKQQKTRAVTNEDRLSVMKSLVTHFSRVHIFIDALVSYIFNINMSSFVSGHYLKVMQSDYQCGY